MSVISVVSPLISKYGQSVTFRHYTGNTYNVTTGENVRTSTDYDIKASVRLYTAKQLTQLILEGDRQVTIAASNVEAEPVAGDEISIDGKWHSVKAINKRIVSDTDAIYILQVRG